MIVDKKMNLNKDSNLKINQIYMFKKIVIHHLIKLVDNNLLYF